MLKNGSKGNDVEALQQGLKDLGFAVDVDGIFGDQTHNAVIALQAIFGYDIDGIAGPATTKLVTTQRELRWNLQVAQKNGYQK